MAHVSVKNTGLAEDTWDSVADEPVQQAPTKTSDYLERNREAWERWSSKSAAVGADAWQTDELRWGLWSTPESQMQLLHGLPPQADVVELGCGSASVSAWLKRSGMRPIGIDFSPAQLRAAEGLQNEFGLTFPLVCANAEQVPFDRESFDVAVSEYGASLWCNPREWLPEARRLLRSGGHLIFFTTSTLLMACTPGDGGAAGQELVRDYFTQYRVEFPGEIAVEFHLTHGHWIRLLRATGFVLEDLIEVRPPRGAKPRYEFVSNEWARRWPSEEVWIARKAA